MARMPFDPLPSYTVALLRRVEALPEINIFHRLFVRGLPAVALPAKDPACYAVFDIGTVGDNSQARWFFKPFQCVDRSQELHTVVRCIRFTALELALLEHGFPLDRAQKHPPASWTGVARTGAVRIGKKLSHGRAPE